MKKKTEIRKKRVKVVVESQKSLVLEGVGVGKSN